MEEQQERESNQSETESYTEHKLKVVDSGECEHYWEPIGRDDEGVMNYACKYCSHGKRLRDEFEVKNGRII